MEWDKENKVEINAHNGSQVIIAGDSATVYATQNNVNDSVSIKKVKFQNNKKQKYIENWNSRLFLHINNDEKPLTLADAFIVPDCVKHKLIKGIDVSESDKLDIVIKKFINYKKTSTMLLAGVPGIGKSSITSWIANKYKDEDSVIILRFRDWKKKELEEGLLNAIYNKFCCGIEDLENTILILDGFDEMKALDIRERLLNDFVNDIKDLDNFKCIITSRPAYVNADHLQVVIQISEFDEKEIDNFYRLIRNSSLSNIKKIKSNLDVLGIPVILYMAIMAKINIDENPTKPELYNRIFAEVGGIFDRFNDGETEYSSGNQIMRNKKNIKEYLKFLCDVSFMMFEKNNLSLKIEELKLTGGQKAARKKTIEEMENNYEGYNFAVKYIMRAGLSGIQGVVAELMEVPSGYEVAVETALGAQMQNIVCDTDASAKRAIFALKENRAGRLTFLPVSSIKGSSVRLDGKLTSDSGYKGLASDCVRFKSEHRQIFEYLLGRVAIVDTMDTAIRLSKIAGSSVRFVTMDGEIINASGAITGGKYKNKTANLLERRSEITALEKEIEDLRKKVLDYSEENRQIADRIEELRNAISIREEEKRDAELSEASLSSTIHALKEAMDSSMSDSKRFEKELATNDKEISDAHRMVKELNQQAADAEKVIGEAENQVEEAMSRYEEKKAVLEEASETITAMRISVRDYRSIIRPYCGCNRRLYFPDRRKMPAAASFKRGTG